MKVPQWILAATLAGALGIQTWIFKELVAIKVELAALRRDVTHLAERAAGDDGQRLTFSPAPQIRKEP